MREYSHPMFNDTGKVICQICGKAFLVISPQHLRKHNVKYADYKERFPEAPLSNEEFAARGRFGKNKDMFVNDEVMGEEVFIDEPDIEEFDMEEALKQEIKDPMTAAKFKILDQLRVKFSNIKMDYLIEETNIQGHLLFSFISDFADPVLKVVVDLPKVFWHNRDKYDDPNRDRKLKETGWKLIKIKSNSPTFEEVQNSIGGNQTNSLKV